MNRICPHCGYSLFGLPADVSVCPECGHNPRIVDRNPPWQIGLCFALFGGSAGAGLFLGVGYLYDLPKWYVPWAHECIFYWLLALVSASLIAGLTIVRRRLARMSTNVLSVLVLASAIYFAASFWVMLRVPF